MRVWIIFFSVVSSVFAAGRTDNMIFDDGNFKPVVKPGKPFTETKIDDKVDRVLDFPNISTAYTFGSKFRTMLQAEIWRQQAMHADVGAGEQFVGASLGYTLGRTGFGNFSVLGGLGYDFDDRGIDWFTGLSHRSTLLGLSSIKTFTGYDLVLHRLRSGFGFEVWERNNWNLDIVGTTKFLGRRNFLGLSLGYDILEGRGGGSKNKLECDLGAFVGWDFSEKDKNGLGAGLSANLRF